MTTALEWWRFEFVYKVTGLDPGSQRHQKQLSNRRYVKADDRDSSPGYLDLLGSGIGADDLHDLTVILGCSSRVHELALLPTVPPHSHLFESCWTLGFGQAKHVDPSTEAASTQQG